MDSLCEWKHPRAPRVALPFDGSRATGVAQNFLRNTKIGMYNPTSGGCRAGGMLSPFFLSTGAAFDFLLLSQAAFDFLLLCVFDVEVFIIVSVSIF